MSKFTDAVRDTLISYFNAGDQPTEAQFTELITKIQEGIEEHQHDSTGDGDGTGILNGSITLAEDAWIGIGAALERIVFNGGDGAVAVMGARLGIGTLTPTYKVQVEDDVAWYVGYFFNDGNNNNRHGLKVQCGADANSTAEVLLALDGNGDTIGAMKGDGAGGTSYWSASDERIKDIEGDLTAEVALTALRSITPKRYKGKGGKKAMTGFIAQDVMAATEGVASYNEEENLYGLDYSRLTAYLWAQNQALLERVEKLEVS